MAPTPFEPARDIPSLTGKVALVTGGNAGIGKATVRALAYHSPKAIYLCGRRHEACEATAAALRQETGYESIVVLDMDLSSLKSVKTAAAAFLGRESRLDLLFLNAGVASVAPTLTKEGYEAQFGINHVGHALLTQLLLPVLLATQAASTSGGDVRDVRVVLTSSNAAFAGAALPRGGLALDAMRTPDPFAPFTLYAHSKLANALFARRLAADYPSLSVTAVQPGVVKSDIWGKGAGGFFSLIMRTVMRFVWVDIDEGAKTQLWCATAKRSTSTKPGHTGDAGVVSGAFYVPVGKLQPYKGATAKQELVDALWDWTTEELAKHGGPGWA
ncbi:short-chain dehydrogenase [Sporothrix schenckii 1099-18]|uniref:Short-chain dehydrogenase n=1 Tax=Sporothrix schenckii 1099-18 TaxID=1397361 RepID=A0A0F2LZV8_SPOSC|nr:short-chain dehydrogenase [Sporothrix schenckii 1099-18]KJR81431.1 short-chain dehydrogenase [Sporothrix schenckii 1099-18]